MVVGQTGKVVAAYRKVRLLAVHVSCCNINAPSNHQMHLFDLDLPTVKLMESSFTTPGSDMVVVDSAAGAFTCHVWQC